MSGLAEKIRAGRTAGKVEVNGHTFHVRRMTNSEAGILLNSGAMNVDIARLVVTGWENVKESDIIPGGSDEYISFDEDAWMEWCVDNPEFWAPIAEKSLQTYKEFNQRRKDVPKQ